MGKLKIYGSSDDLIEVDGDVPGCDEFGSYNSPGFIELSTGEVFEVKYTTGGVWKVNCIQNGNLKKLGGTTKKEPHGKGDDPDPYTETLHIEGPVEWVRFWKEWPVTVDTKREEIDHWISNSGCARDLSDEQVEKLFPILLPPGTRA